ncbi:ABC transporter permease [Pseudalkalibacillus caeni]|uniref:MrsG n=1 Tax=Exobacillus caeni TaxID=2574798 RepID=A0A5R9F3Y1_9BACL|nr:ABC transporter permease [Pseudalkalibacillus caeni]TLS37100.1 hypothetical protein FCL54_11265 [Pseudalkalibacillus caeni]
MKQLLKSEWQKLKRSRIIYLATVLPLLAVIQGAIFAGNSKIVEEEGGNVWNVLTLGGMSVHSSLILPLTITVIMAMVARIEHNQNCWKLLLSLPVKRSSVYFSKFVVGLGLILYSTAVLSAGFLVSGLIVGADSSVPFGLILGKPLLAVAVSLPIIALLFYLSIRFSHVGIPLAVGAGLALPAMLIANSAKYWIVYPWTYPVMATLTETFDMGGKAVAMYAVCLLSLLIVIPLGLFQFRSKDIL